MQYTQLSPITCRVGVNLYMEGKIIGPPEEMISIYKHEVVKGLYGDIQIRLSEIQKLIVEKPSEADLAIRLLIHDMRH